VSKVKQCLEGENHTAAGHHQWLTPVIPATQQAEIRSIAVQGQPWANSSGDPISKNPMQERAGRVAQGESPVLKPQTQKKKKKKKKGERPALLNLLGQVPQLGDDPLVCGQKAEN
jgi:hypothetical protein